mmetsp:Transcript_67067/g.125312  ORF Transcript_67067/g.125312 Transcript_67067/m.125312 type:complete len:202 (-) Transcript_67067:3-608(-)
MGCKVTSATKAGVRHTVKKSVCSNTAMYSGKYLPACRINHFGGRSTGSPRAALSNRSFFGAGHLPPLSLTFSHVSFRHSRKFSGVSVILNSLISSSTSIAFDATAERFAARSFRGDCKPSTKPNGTARRPAARRPLPPWRGLTVDADALELLSLAPSVFGRSCDGTGASCASGTKAECARADIDGRTVCCHSAATSEAEMA